MKRIIILTLLLGANAYAAKPSIFQQHMELCLETIESEWYTKRIQLSELEKTSKTSRLAVLRCVPPTCAKPFSWFGYDVKDNAFSTKITNMWCSIKDGEEPVLSDYRDVGWESPSSEQ